MQQGIIGNSHTCVALFITVNANVFQNENVDIACIVDLVSACSQVIMVVV